LWVFRTRLRSAGLWAATVFSLLALFAAFAFAERFARSAEERMYRGGEVVYAEQTSYQRIALLQRGETVRLYLNGRLQFSSRDEYRYHESLVHPALASVPGARRVLVLGGGDGLALREVLRHRGVESVTLVDIDPGMTRLFRDNPALARLNGGSLADPRVRIVNADAWEWLRNADGGSGAPFDAAIMDLPDPSNYALGRIYSAPFFRLLAARVAPHGRVAVQATSPVAVREAYWCIVATLEAAGWRTAPYHAHVPSFGEWGFVIASKDEYRLPAALPVGLRFLTRAGMPGMFIFSPDADRIAVEPNRLDTQQLVAYYDRGWRRGRE
jgi:spermidine synthase